MSLESSEFSDVVRQMCEVIRAKEERRLKRYPPNVPNDVCQHAIVSGVLVENSPGFKIGDLTPLMELPMEKIFVWTNRRNKDSSIVSAVSTDVKGLNFWGNFGHVFKLVDAYECWFEHIIDSYDYHWIYYFNPRVSIEKCEFLDDDHIANGTFSGSIKKATFFQHVAPLIDLLISDEKFFMATSLLVQSMELHHCCFWCEFQTGGYIRHPSHEPQYWEQASVLPAMEAAIVQATRCVEGILGKPGKNRGRMEERWVTILGMNPNEKYFKTGTTFLDYYYQLFGLRNDAAHSRGNVVFQTTRQRTIEAQCFSWIVLDWYLRKHAKSNEEAGSVIKLNLELMERVDPDMSTPVTLDD